jgi:hypothetical protein
MACIASPQAAAHLRRVVLRCAIKLVCGGCLVTMVVLLLPPRLTARLHIAAQQRMLLQQRLLLLLVAP